MMIANEDTKFEIICDLDNNVGSVLDPFCAGARYVCPTHFEIGKSRRGCIPPLGSGHATASTELPEGVVNLTVSRSPGAMR